MNTTDNNLDTQWAEITVHAPCESVEAVTAILLQNGCHGVAETGTTYKKLVGIIPMDANFSDNFTLIKSQLLTLPEFELPAVSEPEIKITVESDWANEWKKYFKPMEIGERLIVKPTWEELPETNNKVIVEIDPGQAFGTGGHQTTRLCLAGLDRYVEPGMLVADIGTGSGILAIAAAKLGAAKVHATDIDSLPRKIARENVKLNHLEGTVIIHEMDEFPVAAVDCDLVVANIIAMTIIELTPDIYGMIIPGGLFISSGIVDERCDEVCTALTEHGFTILEIMEEEIWRAIVARK